MRLPTLFKLPYNHWNFSKVRLELAWYKGRYGEMQEIEELVDVEETPEDHEPVLVPEHELDGE